jgi:hypothetical protein
MNDANSISFPGIERQAESRSMAIAYLILAHERPRQLARLIEALDCEGVSFFVHVDRKTDIRPFLEKVPSRSNIHLLEDERRVSVYWSGYSTIAAILNLLRVARSSSIPFTRYCLLSGADFPIKNRIGIRDGLLCDTEFMRIDFRLDLSKPGPLADRLRYSHFYDVPALNPRTTRSRTLLSLIERGLQAFPRRRLPDIPIYQGSAWWALTADCVDYIFRYLEEHPEYVDFFRHVSTPDETFFHSIVTSSPFRSRMSHDVEAAQEGHRYDWNDYAAHYIDWATPGIALPKVLELEDLDRLLRSGAFFARKFQPPRSEPLVRKLRKIIEEREPERAPTSVKRI